MKVADLDGLITQNEIPVCPICGLTIHISEVVMIGKCNNLLCLVHYNCGDIEFFDA